MISSVAEHNDSVGSPVLIYGGEVCTKFNHEEYECPTIGLALVDCIEALAKVAYSSNDVDGA